MAAPPPPPPLLRKPVLPVLQRPLCSVPVLALAHVGADAIKMHGASLLRTSPLGVRTARMAVLVGIDQLGLLQDDEHQGAYAAVLAYLEKEAGAPPPPPHPLELLLLALSPLNPPKHHTISVSETRHVAQFVSCRPKQHICLVVIVQCLVLLHFLHRGRNGVQPVHL